MIQVVTGACTVTAVIAWRAASRPTAESDHVPQAGTSGSSVRLPAPVVAAFVSIQKATKAKRLASNHVSAVCCTDVVAALPRIVIQSCSNWQRTLYLQTLSVRGHPNTKC